MNDKINSLKGKLKQNVDERPSWADIGYAKTDMYAPYLRECKELELKPNESFYKDFYKQEMVAYELETGNSALYANVDLLEKAIQRKENWNLLTSSMKDGAFNFSKVINLKSVDLLAVGPIGDGKKGSLLDAIDNIPYLEKDAGVSKEKRKEALFSAMKEQLQERFGDFLPKDVEITKDNIMKLVAEATAKKSGYPEHNMGKAYELFGVKQDKIDVMFNRNVKSM